ncbi:MAG: zinc ribbon domain-containing protein [Actinomycetia bacterium]|nr:zinc ribbon domain-containing protein [Actinomycetes bacterium]
MPLYDYKCPECDTTFEARRSMAEASDPVDCPNGHAGSRRLLSVFATVGGSSSSSAPAPAPMPRAGGHGCGGGMCGC